MTFLHGCQFVKVNKYQASWTNTKNTSGLYFDCQGLVKLVAWLIDNTYVTIGDSIFKQVVGIPMGTDCAPFLANLFLYAYEFEWLNNLLKLKKYTILNKFKRCCRYIDDLLTINNDNLMKIHKK